MTEGRRGTDWDTFCTKIAALPEGTFWRHNQCGDLPGKNGIINRKMMAQLVAANRGRHGFTYSHHKMTKANREVVLMANQNGFTINLSANNLEHADRLAQLGIAPVVTLVLGEIETKIETPKGRTVDLCPAQVLDDVTCEDCQACADPISDSIIGFLPHGCQRLSAERLVSLNS